MLACPYKALGDRVLRLKPLDPLVPQADARTAGLLAHRWLEKAGKEFPEVREEDADRVVARLLELGAFELRYEPPVVKAIWTAKFAKLAPALVARWIADGRKVEILEKQLAKAVGTVTVTAKVDRVEVMGSWGHGVMGPKVIIDFKTNTPPSWAKVANGEKPQLAIEAWLLEGGPDVGMSGSRDVAGVEYWQLKGYGSSPLNVVRSGGKNSAVEDLVAPVGAGLERLVGEYGEGRPFPAVPDLAGGGLMATGHCEWCELSGVCRRQMVAESKEVFDA